MIKKTSDSAIQFCLQASFTTFYLVSAFLCLILSEILSIVNKKNECLLRFSSISGSLPLIRTTRVGRTGKSVRSALDSAPLLRNPTSIRSLSHSVSCTFAIPVGQTYVHYPTRSDICSLSRSVRHIFTIPLGQLYVHYPTRSASLSQRYHGMREHFGTVMDERSSRIPASPPGELIGTFLPADRT